MSAAPESDAYNVQELLQRAIASQRQGSAEAAAALYEQILALEPRHAPALHLLGSLRLEQGLSDRACELLARSIEANPTVAMAHTDYGNALCTAGRPAEALAEFDSAINLAPGFLAAHFNRAVILQELGRLPEAIDGYDRAIKLQPKLGPALFNRAALLGSLRRWEEALRAYDCCIREFPDHAEALCNRGAALLELQRPGDALVSLDKALQLSPRSAKALNNRGNAMRSLQRYAEAVDCFDRAIAEEPQFAEAWRNRGDALRQMGLAERALDSLDTALRYRPGHPGTLLDRAEILIDLKRYPDALASLTTALGTAPETAYLLGLRLHVQSLTCDWEEYHQRAEELVLANDRGLAADYPFPFLSVTDSAAAQLRCARTFADDKFPPKPLRLRKHGRYQHAKIRLAYLSGDFRSHPLSALMVGVFETHDRTRFDVTAVSFRPPQSSPLGSRVKAAFDTFIDASSMADADIALLLKDRETDIAVDLMGFTHGSRPQILAARPAPVQVNYLGFPGTMGGAGIDYLIGDPFVIPETQRSHYAEQVVWLPHCFQANDDRRSRPSAPPARAALGLPDFGFVFCCFNNSYKIKPAFFDAWMRILIALPAAVLWLLADTSGVEANMRGEAGRRGVDPSRLIFAGRVGYEEHLSRLGCADLFLDTLPFNAGTTASDALWAGLPVLTCSGDAFAARMAGSLLMTLGLPELVKTSLADYEAMALQLATSPTLLAALRERLAGNRQSMPLFDTALFCRHLESAYVTMWERAQQGKRPARIEITP